MLKGYGRASRHFACAPKDPENDGGCTKKKKGRLRCHKRPKSREETPKDGSDSGVGLGGRYRTPLAKTIAISGSIERKGSRTDTKVYGARPQDRALPQWVQRRNTRKEQMISAYPLRTDITKRERYVGKCQVRSFTASLLSDLPGCPLSNYQPAGNASALAAGR